MDRTMTKRQTSFNCRWILICWFYIIEVFFFWSEEKVAIRGGDEWSFECKLHNHIFFDNADYCARFPLYFHSVPFSLSCVIPSHYLISLINFRTRHFSLMPILSSSENWLLAKIIFMPIVLKFAPEELQKLWQAHSRSNSTCWLLEGWEDGRGKKIGGRIGFAYFFCARPFTRWLICCWISEGQVLHTMSLWVCVCVLAKAIRRALRMISITALF